MSNTSSTYPLSSRRSVAASLFQRETNPRSSFVSKHRSLHDVLPEEEIAVKCLPPIQSPSLCFAAKFAKQPQNAKFLGFVTEEGGFGIANIDAYEFLCDDGEDEDFAVQECTTYFEAHKNAIFDFCWSHDDMRVATASGDQNVHVVDVETEAVIRILKGHGGSVKCVTTLNSNDDIYVTSARDGHAMLWDLRLPPPFHDEEHSYYDTGTGELIPTYPPLRMWKNIHLDPATAATPQWRKLISPNPKRRRRSRSGYSSDALSRNHGGNRPSYPGDSHRSVTCVIPLRDDVTLVTSGSADGCVKLWDLRRSPTTFSDPVSTLPAPPNRQRHGISWMALDPLHSTHLVVTSVDNSVLVYDMIQNDLLHEFEPRRSHSFYCRVAWSCDSQTFISGSTEPCAYVWEANKPQKPPVAIPGHSYEVSAVCCSTLDPSIFATCSDDSTVRIWKMHKRETERSSDRRPATPSLIYSSLRVATPTTTTAAGGSDFVPIRPSPTTTSPPPSPAFMDTSFDTEDERGSSSSSPQPPPPPPPPRAPPEPKKNLVQLTMFSPSLKVRSKSPCSTAGEASTSSPTLDTSVLFPTGAQPSIGATTNSMAVGVSGTLETPTAISSTLQSPAPGESKDLEKKLPLSAVVPPTPTIEKPTPKLRTITSFFSPLRPPAKSGASQDEPTLGKEC